VQKHTKHVCLTKCSRHNRNPNKSQKLSSIAVFTEQLTILSIADNTFTHNCLTQEVHKCNTTIKIICQISRVKFTNTDS
jgi:hypothetical protein